LTSPSQESCSGVSPTGAATWWNRGAIPGSRPGSRPRN
jgi:hypothetical protein